MHFNVFPVVNGVHSTYIIKLYKHEKNSLQCSEWIVIFCEIICLNTPHSKKGFKCLLFDAGLWKEPCHVMAYDQ